MKFIHIADLHLGKTLHLQSLLPLQIELLQQVLEYSQKQNINVLVIAGDIYDRSVPSKEAVNALNDFLSKAIFTYHKKILMITGNHDSSERLNFASDLLKHQGLYIASYPAKHMEPIVIDDVNFYLVPFFKPSYIRYLYQEELHSYQEAFAYYLSKQTIDTSKANVLVTHQFVAGNNEVVTSESEAILSVGGSEIIDPSIFEDFDYVALGHLHASQKVKRDTIRYSGSLMKYSFDEVKQKKSMVEVEIIGKEVSIQCIPLVASKDVQKYRGTFQALMEEENIVTSDYIAFELEDTMIVPNAIDLMRSKYPNVLQITYPNLIKENTTTSTKANSGFEKLDAISLYQEFYEKMKDANLEAESAKIISEIMEGGSHHDA